jgi:hypothetical protein
MCTGGISVFRHKREISLLKKVVRRRTLGSQATLRLAAPQRELREAKEDGIERKDSMYDLEQSSRRNKRRIVNTN